MNTHVSDLTKFCASYNRLVILQLNLQAGTDIPVLSSIVLFHDTVASTSMGCTSFKVELSTTVFTFMRSTLSTFEIHFNSLCGTVLPELSACTSFRTEAAFTVGSRQMVSS